ncbi:hypothetical protein F-M6_0208 [Faustovirus]|nr:hypothetical protein F-M6_0208 [Faustovirus]
MYIRIIFCTWPSNISHKEMVTHCNHDRALDGKPSEKTCKVCRLFKT